MHRLLLTNVTGVFVEKAVEKAWDIYKENKEKAKTLDELKELEIKQNIDLRVLEKQAKIQQELAIAKRIHNALEVEIEEYYDSSLKAYSGLKANNDSIDLGISGEGQKITKRVFKFKGLKEIEINCTDPEELNDI